MVGMYVYIYRRDTLLQSEDTKALNMHTIMYTVAFLLLSLVPVLTTYVNEFDETFEFTCPKGMSLGSWNSRHDNQRADRRHIFTCKRTPKLGECQWIGYVNELDGPVAFQCPDNGVISGISSFHSNHHGDRRFKFYCCPLKCKQLVRCERSGYVNNFDQVLNFEPPTQYFFKGVNSVHSNVHGDRRFDFETCLIRW